MHAYANVVVSYLVVVCNTCCVHYPFPFYSCSYALLLKINQTYQQRDFCIEKNVNALCVFVILQVSFLS